MVGLAFILHEKGFSVTGSDLSPSANTDLLKKNNIPISIGHSPGNLPDQPQMLVVRSSAIFDNNPEYAAAVKKGYKTIRRGEMLAKVADMYEKTIAVAGTHGKTSVTALLVYLLKTCQLSPGYMIGGKVCGWEKSAEAGDGSLFITESDESDGTQIHLKSDLLLITNIEDDHSWSVGGNDALFANFATIAKNSQQIIYNDSNSTEKLFAFHDKRIPINCPESFLKDKTDWGPFQKENAHLAITCGEKLGIDRDRAICEIRQFPGVERRMSLRHQNENFTVIEDYAHHPTEVKAAIKTLRQRFPKHRLRVIFQPHRYARLEKYLEEFVRELNFADEVIVVPVFSAWSETGPIKSTHLVEKLGKKAKLIESDWATIASYTLSSVKPPEVLAVLGAGDIDNIVPFLKN